MAAVFSIRHYLIDRVAGLIVRGGYFRAAFVWGSAILPHPSSILNSLNPPNHPPTFLAPSPPQRPCYLVCGCVCLCVYMCVRGQAFYVACYLLSISGGQSVASYMGPNCTEMEGEGKPGVGKVMGVSLALGVSDPFS